MVLIEDDILEAAQMTEQEIRIELAVLLYERGRLSFGQARKVAEMGYFEFEKLLAERAATGGYDEPAFEQDLLTLQAFSHGRHQ